MSLVETRTSAQPYAAGHAHAMASAENRRIAERLFEASHLLYAQGASPYRVSAFRNAADAIASHPRSARAIFESEGLRGLDAIPRVGLGIASAIAEMLATGRWAQLERLRGSADPEKLLQTVPGLGPAFARRIHGELHVDSLEGLETAAHDGSLERLPGVGARRTAAWRAWLADTLGRVGPVSSMRREPGAEEPGVDELLDVDREYREKAAAGTLRTIAPKRFNPRHEAWLPVLHARRGPWHFTALYSNTALAHKLGRMRDWVVLYFYDGDQVERSRTVVTETRGIGAGRRVVRGREAECLHEPQQEH
ncbi:MAG TPA: helix-hairpin-helix domain-containing protein [Usitatibacter sp.]|nr:helix-hairpin-helix domain-containing protein [Usitatibacter sp.]